MNKTKEQQDFEEAMEEYYKASKKLDDTLNELAEAWCWPNTTPFFKKV